MNLFHILTAITILTMLALTGLFLWFACIVDLAVYPHEFFITGVAYFLVMLFGIVTAGECGRMARCGKV